MKKQYDVLLFDLDDTIFDFQQSEKRAFTQVFEAYNLNALDYLTDYQEISSKLWSRLEQQQLTLSDLGTERFQQLFDKHHLTLDAKAFNDTYLHFLGMQPFLITGAENLFQQLHHVRIAAISNGFERVQTARIALCSFSEKFEALIISETVGHQKPSQEIFDYAFEKLQLKDKSSVLMIGDSLTSDIKGGQNYGIDTCWFNPTAKVNISEVQPTYEIRRLDELLAYVKPLPIL